MGLKFEYTLNPLHTHWDADHVAYLERRRRAPGRSIDHPGLLGTTTVVPLDLPGWPDELLGELRDKTIPIVTLALTTAVLEAIKTGSAVLVISLPAWIPAAILVLVLADIARRQIWKDHPESKLMNIRLLCPNQDTYDALAHHFQGTWEF